MDIAEVKSILQITSTKHDEYFTTALPMVEDYAKTYCGVDTLPEGAKLFVAKALEYNMQSVGVSSKSMGEVSYSYETEFPPSLLKLLKPYRKLRFS